jgi:hypothetical protein
MDLIYPRQRQSTSFVLHLPLVSPGGAKVCSKVGKRETSHEDEPSSQSDVGTAHGSALQEGHSGRKKVSGFQRAVCLLGGVVVALASASAPAYHHLGRGG